MAAILKLDTIQTSNGLGVITSPNKIVYPGAILQTVNATTNTQFSTTSTTYVSSGFTATITPMYANSKILVMYTCGGIESNSTAVTPKGSIQVWRNGSSVFTVGNMIMYGSTGSAGPAANFYDMPNSTSAITYTMYFSSYAGTFYVGTNSSNNTLTLLEIAQ